MKTFFHPFCWCLMAVLFLSTALPSFAQDCVCDESNLPPVLTPNGDFTFGETLYFGCNADPADILLTENDVTVTDDCDPNPSVIFFDIVQSSDQCSNNWICKWIATDECGLETADSVFVIIMNADPNPPTITCPNDTSVACEMGVAPSITGMPLVTGCGELSVTHTDSSSAGFENGCGKVYRTWTVTDDCNNSASCVQHIFLEDSEAPVLIPTGDFAFGDTIYVQCGEAIYLDESDVSVSDNCTSADAITVTFADLVKSNTECMTTWQCSWTAIDACGNVGAASVCVVVEKNVVPTITCPVDVTVACGTDTSPEATGTATATGCREVSVNYLDIENTVEGGCGTITREWTATDDCGNEMACTQTITVEDAIPPSIACPADLAATCSTTALDIEAWINSASGTDNCDDNVAISHDYVAGAFDFCDGDATSITVNFTATDNCGNDTSCAASITIEADTTDPMITCPGDLALPCDYTQANIDQWLGMATATDNCDSEVSISHNFSDGPSICGEAFGMLITFTATDDCGNQATCSAKLFIIDEVAPVLDCPSELMIDCNYAQADIDTWLTTVSATDNCDTDVTITHDYEAGDISFCPATAQTIIVTFTATDNCGNASSCSGHISITADDQAPALTCPQPLNLSCGYVQAEIDAWLTTAVATDNCDSDLVINNNYDGSAPELCDGANGFPVTFTVADACGNSSSCVGFIILNDEVVPEISCPDDLVLTCGYTQAEIDTWLASVSATDNCDSEVSLNNNYDGAAPIGCGDNGGFTVTFTATDDCGNATTCSASVILSDEVVPVITCPADLDLTCGYDQAEIDAWLLTATATDNCDNAVDIANNYTMGSLDACGDNSSLTVTFTATDDCGNAAECTATISLSDDEAPVITCPTDLVLDCNYTQGEVSQWLASVMATDNCDEDVLITNNCPISTGMDICDADGFEVTFVATDDCNNSTICTATIFVLDEEAPMISCPADLILACNNYTEADITEWLGLASAIDNCDDAPSVTYDYDAANLGGCGADDALTVTFTATDACGNATTCTADIVVVDDQAPSLSCPENLNLSCGYDVSEINEWIASVTATDNCTDAVTLSNDYETTDLGPCGDNNSIVVLFTATDDCGNSSQCAASIIITDDVAPSLLCPIGLTLDCGYDPADITEWLSSVSATDNCDDAPTLSNDFVSLPEEICADDNGVVVTFTALDACGNSSTCTAIISYVDNENPSITTCPDDLTLNCGYTQADIDAWLASFAATDNCGTPTISNNYADAAISPCGTNGSVPITFTATDNCGNATTCTANLIISDDEAPMIDCPDDLTLTCGYTQAEIDLWLSGVTASDACDADVNISHDYMGGLGAICDASGSVTVTFTATDDCGNASTCTADIHINDDMAPEITLNLPDGFDPQFEFGDTIHFSCNTIILMNESFVIATDNCDNDVTVEFVDVPIEETDCYWFMNCYWRATDDCGNSTTESVYVYVEKNTPATLTLPDDATVSCEDQLPPDPSVTGMATATGCGEVALEYSDDMSGLTGCSGTGVIIRTWTATNHCGHEVSGQQNIYVQDDEAPTLVLDLPSQVTDFFGSFEFGDTLHFYCDTVLLLNETVVIASDNCDDDVEVGFVDFFVVDNGCSAFMECGWIATDDCGNSHTEYIYILVEKKDGAPVELSCPGETTVGCGESYDPSVTGMASTLGCTSSDPYYEDDLSGLTGCNGSGLIVRTWYAISTCGEVVSCQQVINVVDDEAPELSTNLGTDPQYPFEFGDTIYLTCSNLILFDTEDVTATDNCGTEVDVSFVDVLSANDDCYQLWECVWTASDACGNEASQSVFVHVAKAGPLEVSCPPDVEISCDVDYTDLDLVGSAVATGCGGNLMVNYSDDLSNYDGCTVGHISRTWYATNDCGLVDSCTQTIYINPGFIGTLEIKVILQGAMTGMAPKPGTSQAETDYKANEDSQAEIMMRDDLRSDDLVPLTEPYTALNSFTHVGGGGGETTTEDVLAVTGLHAVIDWVFVQLRDDNDATQVIATRSALLLANGDVVDVDGVSSLDFDVPGGDYHIAIRHRNHLGAMTASTVGINNGSTTFVDFTNTTTATYGNHAQIDMGGMNALWAGNSDGNNSLIFQGGDNDANAAFFDVLSAPENVDFQINYVLQGYYSGDNNMNCQVIYQGGENDINPAFFNILLHPDNILANPSFIINEQLP